MPDFFIVLNEISQLWFSNIKDEMKLHKLLYFAQRETIAILGQPMFDAEFEGWKHGPVCRKIREAFTESGIDAAYTGISFDSAYIVRNVIEEYGVLETWQLRNLSHREISWKNSRIGLNNNEAGVVTLKLSDIRIDAQKVRPYDHIWDMYYDEFDEVESMS